MAKSKVRGGPDIEDRDHRMKLTEATLTPTGSTLAQQQAVYTSLSDIDSNPIPVGPGGQVTIDAGTIYKNRC